MFDVGFSELVLLFVIGLLILGPERLPRVAAKIGRWVGRARRTATQLRMQFEREMTMQDIMSQQRKSPRPNETKKKEETKPSGTQSGGDNATAAVKEPADAAQAASGQASAPETTESGVEKPDADAAVARSDEAR